MARKLRNKKANSKGFSPQFFLIGELIKEFNSSNLSPAKFAESESMSEDKLWNYFRAHDEEAFEWLNKDKQEREELFVFFDGLKESMDQDFAQRMEWAHSLEKIPRSNKNYVTFLDETRNIGPPPEYEI